MSVVSTILRKCVDCGLEAHTTEDLEKFSATPSVKYGRRNICKECYNAIKREYRKNPETNKRRKKNKRHSDLRRIIFLGKRIYLKKNPRTNVCEECGRRYPDDLKEQTSVHHEIYDLTDPLANTKELCRSCHSLGDKNANWKGEEASDHNKRLRRKQGEMRARPDDAREPV